MKLNSPPVALPHVAKPQGERFQGQGLYNHTLLARWNFFFRYLLPQICLLLLTFATYTMDPASGVATAFGLASSIVTLAGLALESSKTLNTLRTRLGNVTDDLRHLVETVQSLSGLISELQNTFKNDQEISPSLTILWDTQFLQMEKDLGDFNALVKKLAESLTQKSTLGLKIRLRAKWVCSEEVTRRYNERLATHLKFLEIIQDISTK